MNWVMVLNNIQGINNNIHIYIYKFCYTVRFDVQFIPLDRTNCFIPKNHPWPVFACQPKIKSVKTSLITLLLMELYIYINILKCNT